MPSRRIAALIALSAGLCFAWLGWSVTHGGLIGFDESIRASLHAIAAPSWTFVMEAITLLGSQLVILCVTMISAIVFYRFARYRTVALMLGGMAVGELFEASLKVEFHRQRPEPFFDTVLPGSYSFPSGHALLSTCAYGLLASLIAASLDASRRWIAYSIAAALIFVIGASRIYLGVHHPTDVIGGYLVGIAWLAALRAIFGSLESSA